MELCDLVWIVLSELVTIHATVIAYAVETNTRRIDNIVRFGSSKGRFQIYFGLVNVFLVRIS